MPDPGRGAVRVIRTLVLALATLSLAAVAHVAGGGEVPPWPALLVLAPAIALPCALLTRRQVHPVVILAVLGLGQVALHHLFCLVASALSNTGRTYASTGDGHHSHRGHLTPAMEGAGASAPDLAHLTHSPGVTMVFTHLLATLLLGAVLAHGESAIHALRAAWQRTIPTLAAQPLVVARSLAITVPDCLHPSLLRRLAPPRRGPPAAAPA